MTYLTLKETGSVINNGIIGVADLAHKDYVAEVYAIREHSDRKTRLLWLYVNALNYYIPNDALNYLTDLEALQITEKLHDLPVNHLELCVSCDDVPVSALDLRVLYDDSTIIEPPCHSSCDLPAEVDPVIIAPPPPPPPSPKVFNTKLSYNAGITSSAAGITAIVGDTDPVIAFEFDAIANPEGLPNSMEIAVDTIGLMVVDFPADYLGQEFRFTDTNGAGYENTFINGTRNFEGVQIT